GDLLADREQVAAVEVGRIVGELALDPEGAGALAYPRRVERRAGGDRRLGDLGRGRGADQTQVHDLDRRVGEVMSVFALVDLMESLKRLGERGVVERAVGERHAQLVALADIAQV